MKLVVFGQAIIHHPVAWPKELRDLVAGADAVICNFEGCLPPDGTWPMKSKTVHPAHPDALAMLGDLGVTHLGIANNHAWDFGHAGLIETRRRIAAAGFAVAGAGRDRTEAWRPATRNGAALIAVDCGPTPDWAVAGAYPGVAALRVARRFRLRPDDIRHLRDLGEETGDAERRRRRRDIGYDRADDPAGPLGLDLVPGEDRGEIFEPNRQDLDLLFGTISDARASAEKVVVALHYHLWSPAWVSAPRWLIDLSRSLTEAGADAVCCSGPPFAIDPVPSGGGIIVPSLGNLVFHTARGPAYDRAGLSVWRGLAAILENGRWTTAPHPAMRPDPQS